MFEDIGELRRQWGLEEAKSWRKDIYKKVSMALTSYCFPGPGLWWFTRGDGETGWARISCILRRLGRNRGGVLANTPGFPLRTLQKQHHSNRNEPETEHPLQRLKPTFTLIQYVMELKWLYWKDYILPYLPTRGKKKPALGKGNTLQSISKDTLNMGIWSKMVTSGNKARCLKSWGWNKGQK